jgi:hypothetical protein
MRYHVTVRPSDLALEAKNAELRREVNRFSLQNVLAART